MCASCVFAVCVCGVVVFLCVLVCDRACLFMDVCVSVVVFDCFACVVVGCCLCVFECVCCCGAVGL